LRRDLGEILGGNVSGTTEKNNYEQR
jgi:hypothetical protein